MNFKDLPFNLLIIFFLISGVACEQENNEAQLDKVRVIAEVNKMFDDYHEAIKREGLTGEFKYLDNSEDFFWVVPGYSYALPYDSVYSILSRNAPGLETVEFHWRTLKVFPLSDQIATFTGIVEGVMVDTSGVAQKISLIESGSVIKRNNQWKLLCGQTTGLPPPAK